MVRSLKLASSVAVGSIVALAALTGCATNGFVREQVAGARTYTDSKVGEVSGNVEQVRGRADEAYQKASLLERLAAGDYTEVSTQQVQFAFDDYRIADDAKQALDQLAAQFATHPRYALEVRGYADATGTDRYNYKLGRERADEVLRYFMTQHNVPMARVAIVSFGEDSPVAENDSRDGRAQNRRVQVRLLEVQPQSPPVSMAP